METLLTFKSALSNKFWKITVAEDRFIVNYGKTGSGGSISTRIFASPEACQKEAEKLIQSKLKKGYQTAESVQQVVKESTMTEDYFWALLNQCKDHGEDINSQVEWLLAQLSQKPLIDIIAFDSILNDHYRASYTSNLWAATFTVLGGCTDDDFDDFRGWIVYLGKDAYYKAIENPETLLPHLNRLEKQKELPKLKGLLTVACEAYEAKTGLEAENYRDMYDQLLKEEKTMPGIKLAWDEDHLEALHRKFPGLWEAFGANPLSPKYLQQHEKSKL